MPSLNADLLKRLNTQIDNELHAAHQYLAMSAHFEAEDLPGCAAWMRGQADEERLHAMKFYQHIDERGGRIELGAIGKPAGNFKDPVDVFTAALKHEQGVTRQIYELFEAARDAQDYALQVFLNWFVTEQVEEENTFEQLVEKFKRAGQDPTALMLLDNELAGRAAAPE